VEQGLKQLCIDLEHFETPEWAAAEILKHEILTQTVIDPCTGTGILADAATKHGYCVFMFDVNKWNRHETALCDYLIPNSLMNIHVMGNTVFMNPPFSKAEEFVKRSLAYGARKVVCFQRFAWWESKKRREFWNEYPPNRIYICGDRASCWRHDIPQDERGSGTPTAHAWFVWEQGHPSGTQLSHIYKS